MKGFKPQCRVVAFSVLCLLTSACTYRVDVAQGNELQASDLQKLSIGMSKEEVGQIIGYPLLNDLFHTDRWDYVAFYAPGYNRQQYQSQVQLKFAEDRLIAIESDQFSEMLSSEDQRAKKRLTR